MNSLKEVLLFGNDILNKAKNNYIKKMQPYNDKLDQLKIINILTNDDDENARLMNKIESLQSYIDYINFINREFNNIQEFIEMESTLDFQYGCMYFGNGTLYYNNEFLKFDIEEQFDIIINHIMHYTGCLYMIQTPNVRLSYTLLGLSICYGKPINYKNGQQIYDNYKRSYNHIIFDIGNTYKDFVLRNRKFMTFIKDSPNNTEGKLTYRIALSSMIKLENMIIHFINDNDAYVTSFGRVFDNVKDEVYKL